MDRVRGGLRAIVRLQQVGARARLGEYETAKQLYGDDSLYVQGKLIAVMVARLGVAMWEAVAGVFCAA